MGLFKDTIAQEQNETQHEFLSQLGFEYGTNSGPKGERGWTRTISSEDSLYRIWITVDIKEREVHLYCEYDVGGEVWSRTTEISEETLEDREAFIEWIDDEISV